MNAYANHRSCCCCSCSSPQSKMCYCKTALAERAQEFNSDSNYTRQLIKWNSSAKDSLTKENRFTGRRFYFLSWIFIKSCRNRITERRMTGWQGIANWKGCGWKLSRSTQGTTLLLAWKNLLHLLPGYKWKVTSLLKNEWPEIRPCTSRT